MSESRPRVTIGVPVFNGESIVAETLDSLLNQTFSDFEIVISDNASTDRTEQICRTYAAGDPRIRYYRSDTNRGAAWNHNRVFELARGEYFKWNSADDLCAPEFLARCVATLDEDTSAVMACSKVLVIDDYGDPVGPGFIPDEVASPSTLQRFRRVVQTDHWCFHVYSLIRATVLRQAGPMGYYTGSDRVLLSKLSLFGRCVLISDALLSNRDHSSRFTRSFGEKSRQGTAWFDSGAAARKQFPYWREFRGYLEAISRSSLGWLARLRYYWVMLGWLRYHRGPLLDDLIFYPRMWLNRHLKEDKAAPTSRVAATPAKPQDNAPMSVSVILCTYNRCEDLKRALQSIAACRMPSSSAWEVLVVDNNSTDATREIVEDFGRRYPDRFRYLFEPTPGKSYALNAGVANAHGEILAFVDDDVTVEPRWLRNLVGIFRSGEWAGSAGRIFPAQSFTPPHWLSWQYCGGMLCASFDLGSQPREMDIDHPPNGANMAFRKSVFEKYGGFRVDLGPGPNRNVVRASEDADFACRLMKAGESLRYEPLAVVYHVVPQARINKEFFLSRWFEFGRATIRQSDDHREGYGTPRDYLRLIGRAVQLSATGVQWIFARNAGTRFFRRCMIWKQAGMMNELSRRLFGRKVAQTTVLQ